MDFLGPGAYFHAREFEDTGELVDQRKVLNDRTLLARFAKSRSNHHLTDLSDLLRPENYQLLPGLQQAWLGDYRGPLRNKMNELFISSWKCVLELCTHTEADVQARKNLWKGSSPYTIDWFLPVALGGLGLEDTSGRGVRASSKTCRRLAHFLKEEPLYRLNPLPAIGTNSRAMLAATSKTMDLVKSLRSEGRSHMVRPDQLGTEISDILGYYARDLSLSSFGSAFFDTDHGERGSDFFSNHSKRVSLHINIQECFSQRQHLWNASMKRQWENEECITQRELDNFSPLKEVFDIDLPKCPDVDSSVEAEHGTLSRTARLPGTTSRELRENHVMSGEFFPQVRAIPFDIARGLKSDKLLLEADPALATLPFLDFDLPDDMPSELGVPEPDEQWYIETLCLAID
jgi:hypothetical protein